jgi:hypothetical protein
MNAKVICGGKCRCRENSQYFLEWPSDNNRYIRKTPWPESASELYRQSDHRLSAKLVPTFADRGCQVVRVTDPYGRILGFLDRNNRYRFFESLFFPQNIGMLHFAPSFDKNYVLIDYKWPMSSAVSFLTQVPLPDLIGSWRAVDQLTLEIMMIMKLGCADTPLCFAQPFYRLEHFYFGLKYHCTSSCSPVLSLINSLFWCSINHTETIEQNALLSHLKVMLLNYSVALTLLQTTYWLVTELVFVLCGGVIQESFENGNYCPIGELPCYEDCFGVQLAEL